jgi:hypothetical protein
LLNQFTIFNCRCTLAWNLGNILCFISWTFFLFDCKKIDLLIMLQAVCKVNFYLDIWTMLTNVDLCACIVSWRSVSGDTWWNVIQAGVQKSLGDFSSYIMQVYLHIAACIICIVLVLNDDKTLDMGKVFPSSAYTDNTTNWTLATECILQCENDLYYFCLRHNIS